MTPGIGQSIGILLVEDDPNDVLLVRRALELVGGPISLDVVGDGDAALAYLGARAQEPDSISRPLPRLVLLDIELPKRSGLEVLEWLRGQPVLRRVPVIALTSSRQQRDLDRAYDLGITSYLVKPVRLHAVVETFQHVVTYWTQLNHPPGGRTPEGPPSATVRGTIVLSGEGRRIADEPAVTPVCVVCGMTIPAGGGRFRLGGHEYHLGCYKGSTGTRPFDAPTSPRPGE